MNSQSEWVWEFSCFGPGPVWFGVQKFWLDLVPFEVSKYSVVLVWFKVSEFCLVQNGLSVLCRSWSRNSSGSRTSSWFPDWDITYIIYESCSRWQIWCHYFDLNDANRSCLWQQQSTNIGNLTRFFQIEGILYASYIILTIFNWRVLNFLCSYRVKLCNITRLLKTMWLNRSSFQGEIF